jgi:hypothetical protein
MPPASAFHVSWKYEYSQSNAKKTRQCDRQNAFGHFYCADRGDVDRFERLITALAQKSAQMMPLRYERRTEVDVDVIAGSDVALFREIPRIKSKPGAVKTARIHRQPQCNFC